MHVLVLFCLIQGFTEFLPKLINKKGIINVGGKAQSVFKFAKKYNPKIKRRKADKNQPLPLKQDMNLNKLYKLI